MQTLIDHIMNSSYFLYFIIFLFNTLRSAQLVEISFFVIVAVPVYQFIIKCYYFCQIKMSMLQRTGIGIALIVLGKLGYVILDLSVSVPILYQT